VESHTVVFLFHEPFFNVLGLIYRRPSDLTDETDVEELEALVIRAQSGDWRAYEPIVQRFQDMAVGYGYSVLGDIQLAEDAAQEAFINAYCDLPALRDPAAFPGWFRRIVFKHIDRIRRRKQADLVPLDQMPEIISREPSPAEVVEKREMQNRVFEAIETLPEHQRVVVTLFYISEYSQREISSFLEIPVSTVKTRLHGARKRLKERMMINVIQDALPKQRPSRNAVFTEKVMSLFEATAEGDAAQVKALLAEEPALASATGRVETALWRADAPALHVAVMHGRKDIVDLLLAHGADVNERDEKHGFNALLHAIDLADFLPDYAELGMVDFLISRGAKKDIFALLWLGDDEGVKAILEKDPASINAIGPGNGTPLCYAHTVERAQLLLDHGADLYARLDGKWGHTTPLRWIANHGVSTFNTVNLLRFLLDQTGVEIDIFLACVLGETEAVASALESDPALARAITDDDHVLDPGLTALHLAAQFGRIEIARLLLEHGADVNAKSPAINNMTPLHLAVWRGHRKLHLKPMPELVQEYGVYHLLSEMPRLLLEHGANVNARDSQRNLTPLGWAEAEHEDETDRSEVAALLREFGAQ